MLKAIDVGKTIRLNRIFKNDKALIVPIDDSMISGPELGLRDMRTTIRKIVRSDATAMMMTYGSYVRNYDIIENFPCILNVTGSTALSSHTKKVIIHDVENALIDGFCGVAAHINISSQYESEMLAMVGEISSLCNYYSMPLMVIAYPRKEDINGDNNYKHLCIGDYSKIIRHCTRIAVELGADIVKTHYTGTPESFKSVIECAEGVPVLISGQSLVSETQAINNVSDSIKVGGSGVCFGRNIYNRNNTEEFITILSKEIWK